MLYNLIIITLISSVGPSKLHFNVKLFLLSYILMLPSKHPTATSSPLKLNYTKSAVS